MPKKTSSGDPKEIHVRGLLDRVKAFTDESADSAVLFLLGSGASRQSGIKTGGEMVGDWLEMLRKEDPDHETVQEGRWATAARLEIPGFDPGDPAASYPQIFARAYRGRRKAGFDYLETEVAGRAPSLGYSVLAQILSGTKHKILVTTNFDNLAVEALSIYTTTAPVVCGPESLAGFLRHHPTRPQIVRVHQDLFYAPKHTADELGSLPKAFAGALGELFTTNVPVVIGYGGNDGGLMKVLKDGSLELQQGLYWCYFKGDGRPRRQILDLVAGHGGWLVPIDGFDELMVGLHDTLELESLDGFLRKRGNERATRYRELRGRGRDIRAGAKANATAAEDPPVKAGAKANATVAEDPPSDVGEEVEAAPADDPPSDEGAEAEATSADDPPSDVRAETGTTPEEDAQVGTAHGRAQAEFADAPRSLRVVTTRTVPGRTPQEWDSLAMLESDPIKQAQIYEDGLRALPQSAWMAAYAALFYEGTSATAQRAEDLHLRSIDLAGSDSGILTNYANFLTDIRQDHDAAEALYQRALEADPARISTLGNYANFLRNVQGNHEKAEELYQRVLEIDPNRPSTLGNYALLLAEDRQDYTAAEALYKRALEAGPNHANNLINYANFLTDVRQDYAAAEALYKRAMEVDPENADRLRDYANFLTNIRQDFATAGLLYKRAQEIDPDEVNEFGY